MSIIPPTNMFGVPVERTIVFNGKSRSTIIPSTGGRPFLPAAHVQVGCLHTTEGHDNVDGAWSTLLRNSDPPNLICGMRLLDAQRGIYAPRIIMCREFDYQAAALRGQGPLFANARVSCQIEIATDSQQQPWLPKWMTLEALVAAMAWCTANGLDIPLIRPTEFKDDLSDCPLPWAVDYNSRRKLIEAHGNGFFKTFKGWLMHMEIPGNFHWDCGMLKWAELFAMVQQVIDAGSINVLKPA
jgi:hypothetical protein